MTKHLPFVIVTALWCCAASAGCSGGDYCRDNCEYVQRCQPEYAGAQDLDTCIDQCEQQLASVSDDCRDALDDLGDCVVDTGCNEMELQSECLDESLDVLSACEDEFFDTADTCTGSPLPCDVVGYDQQSCEQQGCTFGQACGGSVDSCSSIYDQTECEQQVGCTYAGDACTGTAAACDTLTAAPCETQRGCLFEEACTGTPPPCQSLLDEDSCEAVGGCFW